MDCSLPGSSVHGIFQARLLEWGAIAFSKGTPINIQVRSTNCAKLWTGRQGGEDKTSRPNPSPGDASPGAESHILGNDLGQHRAQGTRLVGATVFPSPTETSPDPRIKAQCTHVKFPHWQEMHSLESGWPDSFAPSKMKGDSRPLPPGSFLSHGLNMLEVHYQGVSPTQAFLLPGQCLTLASVRTSSSVHLTCLPSRWT